MKNVALIPPPSICLNGKGAADPEGVQIRNITLALLAIGVSEWDVKEKNEIFKVNFARFCAFFLPEASTQTQVPYLYKK